MRCPLCGNRSVALSPPPRIKESLPCTEIIRARMCTVCHFSWTTIERECCPTGATIRGGRVINSECFGSGHQRRRVVGDTRVNTMEEAKEYPKTS